MVPNGKYDFFTSGIKKYKTNTYSFEGPAITIAGNGATVGYIHKADDKFDAYQRTYVLDNIKLNRDLLTYVIERNLPKKIKEESRTGNIPYIVMDMLTDLKIRISKNKNEQEKIAKLLVSIQKQITFNECNKKSDISKEMPDTIAYIRLNLPNAS